MLKKKPKWEPPPPTRIGKKKRRGPNVSSKLPTVTPTARSKLRLLKQLRIKDHLLMEEEFVALHQVRVKEKELKEGTKKEGSRDTDDETLLANLKGSPLGVGTLEEIIDDDHAIVSSTSGPEYYVPIMSFVDKELLEPGCSVLLHQKVVLVIICLQ
jgi:26S proteasome regulatory subunit T2